MAQLVIGSHGLLRLDCFTVQVDIEITSPVAGVITKHLFSEGDAVAVGNDLFEIDTEGTVTNRFRFKLGTYSLNGCKNTVILYCFGC
jgi:hypothetical protein